MIVKALFAIVVSMIIATTVSPQIQKAVDPCKVFPCHARGPR